MQTKIRDFYLEEENENTVPGNIANSEESISKVLEKLLEIKESKPENQNLGKISARFMIEKFSSKAPNAHQWISEFEKECERFEINKDENKIEILKYFLEKSCLDWYRCVLMKYTVNSE